MLKDNDTKFEIAFTGSSVESITRMMTDRMMSSNTSVPMTSGFDFKIQGETYYENRWNKWKQHAKCWSEQTDGN